MAEIFKYYRHSPEVWPITPEGSVPAFTAFPDRRVVALRGEVEDITTWVDRQTEETLMVELTEDEFVAEATLSAQTGVVSTYITARVNEQMMLKDYFQNPLFDECLWRCFATSERVLKEVARERIALEIGDDRDIIADVSKRVGLLERMVMWCFNDLMTEGSIQPAEIESYLPFIQQYLGAVNLGVLVDRVDLEDKPELMARLTGRFCEIASIVQGSYLSKLEFLPAPPEEPSAP